MSSKPSEVWPVTILNPDSESRHGTIQKTTQGILKNSGSETDFIYQFSERGHGSDIQDEMLIDIVSSYVSYYASGKGHTARAKRYDLEYFLKFLAGTKRKTERVILREWTLQSTKNFIEYLLEKGEAPSTVSRRLATIKHLGRTLADRVPGFINPAREIKAPVYETGKPQGLDDEEIVLLKETARRLQKENSDSFQALRNSLIIEFLLGTGLRADEVRFLKRGQVSEDRIWIKNVKTKGKRFRDVYIHAELALLLDEYLDSARAEIVSKYPGALSWSRNEWSAVPVFISTHRASLLQPESFALAPKTLWRVISDFGRKAQSLHDREMPHLHPHKLRHTFAHGLLGSSNDIRLVAQALGHSDVRTTMRYTERTKDELAKAIEKKEKNTKK